MKILLIAILLILTGISCKTNKPITAQEQLGHNLINSLKEKNGDQLISLFSEKYAAGYAKDADRTLKLFVKLFKKEYGEINPNDFSFKFIANYSNSEEGKLYFFHKGKQSGDMKVIKARNNWYFNEL